MDFLLDPMLAYLILLGGILLAFLAIITPGTGILELGAVFCFFLVGYAVYNWSMDGWGSFVSVLSGINLIVALLATASVTGFMWFSVQKSRDAAHAIPAHDLEGLVGQIGEARTEVHEEGSVQVGAELWSARSEKEIPAGSSIRVVGREGFVVIVEQADGSTS